MAADMLTNLVRELDDHDLSVLHTRNTQNGLVGVACVNPLHKKISRTVDSDRAVETKTHKTPHTINGFHCLNRR